MGSVQSLRANIRVALELYVRRLRLLERAERSPNASFSMCIYLYMHVAGGCVGGQWVFARPSLAHESEKIPLRLGVFSFYGSLRYREDRKYTLL